MDSLLNPTSSSSSLSGSFLDCLPFHPAFAVLSGSLNSDASLPSNAVVVKSTTNSKNPSFNLPYFPKHALLGLRGDDLLIGSAGSSGNGLVALNLAALLREWDRRVERRTNQRPSEIELFNNGKTTSNDDKATLAAEEALTDDDLRQLCASVPARNLVLTALDFSPRVVKVNSTGRLAAIAGDKDICVAVLPRGSLGQFAKTETEELDEDKGSGSGSGEPIVQPTPTPTPTPLELRSFKVGEYYHSTDPRHSVVSIEWHPLADGGSTLGVLSSEGVLRFYDLTASSSTPSLTLNLLPPPTSLTPPAVAFSIPYSPPGSDDSEPPFSGLVIYGMNQAGDIYAACPVLPPGEHCISNAQLRALAVDPHGSDESRSWARSVLSQSIPHPRLANALLVTMPRPLTPVLRQGPLRIQPTPPELAGGAATDLKVVEISGSLRAWFASWADGKLEIGLDVGSVDAKFADRSVDSDGEESMALQAPYGASSGVGLGEDEEMDASADNDSAPLLLLSSLSLSTALASDPSLSKMAAPAITLDPLYNDTVYISHATGLHAVSIQTFIDAAVHGSLPDIASPTVSQLVDTTTDNKQANPVLGVTVSDSPLLSRLFIAAAQRGGAAGRQLPLRIRGLETKAPDPVISEQELGVLESAELEAFVPLLSSPFAVPRGLLLGMPSAVRLSKGGEQDDVEVLRRLAEGVKGLRERVVGVWEGGGEVEDRIELQKLHVERTNAHLTRIQHHLDSLLPSATTLASRLESLLQTQRRLRRKADSLLDVVLDINRPELSREEKEWSREVDNVGEKVPGMSGEIEKMRNQFNLLQSQLSALQPQQQEPLTTPSTPSRPPFRTSTRMATGSPNPFFDSGSVVARRATREMEKPKLDEAQMKRILAALDSEFHLLKKVARDAEKLAQETEAAGIELGMS